MKEKLLHIKTQALDWFHDSSQREKVLIVGGTVVVFLLVGHAVLVKPAFAFLEEQKIRLEEAEKNIKQLPYLLASYKRLINRQSAIKDLYKRIELSEGAFAHLEKLVEQKAGIPTSSFTIKEGSPVRFGDEYEQIPYTVKFRITDYPRLIEFLDEVMFGEKPLVISTLDMRTGRLGDHIQVDMQVTSVRRTN